MFRIKWSAIRITSTLAERDVYQPISVAIVPRLVTIQQSEHEFNQTDGSHCRPKQRACVTGTSSFVIR